MPPKIIFVLSVAFLLDGILGLQVPFKPRHNKVVACYVATWATYRPGKGQFQFSDLKPEHCTHLIYAFAGLDATTSTIKSLDPYNDLEEDYGKGTYVKMTGLRAKYPGLKVSLAIGGWNEGSANYSALAASPEKRSKFVSSVVEFLRKYRFDGLDLDWEFPARRGGAPYDRENFVSLVKDLKNAFAPNGFSLTAAISANTSLINDAYNIRELSEHLDYIHLMAYDYHGAYDKQVLPNAPLSCKDQNCVEESVRHLLNMGTSPSKLILGLPLYGRTFILTSKLNSSLSPIGAPSLETGFSGPFTREDGLMGYNEICIELISKDKNWTTGWDNASGTPYIVSEDKVVVYDNAESLATKAAYANNLGLAGVMVWSIDTDDFQGDCAVLHKDFLDPLYGEHYPLMRSINQALEASPSEHEDNHINNLNSSAKTSLSFASLILVICGVLSHCL